jgi:hypothetical protein
LVDWLIDWIYVGGKFLERIFPPRPPLRTFKKGGWDAGDLTLYMSFAFYYSLFYIHDKGKITGGEQYTRHLNHSNPTGTRRAECSEVPFHGMTPRRSLCLFRE